MGDETSWSLRLMGRNENEGVCSDLVEQKWTNRNVVAARPLTLLGVILPSRRPEPPHRLSCDCWIAILPQGPKGERAVTFMDGRRSLVYK